MNAAASKARFLSGKSSVSVHRDSSRLLDVLGYRMRRWPPLHRIGHWLRRTLWTALADGFWEFARNLFASSARLGPPANVFSAYQALRCGWPPVKGRIVLHDQGVPEVGPESLLATSGLGQHAEQPWPIFWSEHSHARLVTESLAHIVSGKKLCVESAYGDKRWRYDTASRFLRLPSPVHLAGNWTSIVSHWTPTNARSVYGHWLHDALPRLALLSEFPPDTRIIVPSELAPYQKETLELVGVWDRCRPTPERHLEVERYFFSAPTSMITCYNPYSVKFLRGAFLPARDPHYVGPRKFFFQRTVKRRAIENSDELGDFFRNQGWAVVRDMDLTFAQTVKLFSEAEAICSTLGSNMCNLMFCPPGCVVMQFVLDGWPDGFVDWIAQVAHLNYHSRMVPCGGKYMHQIRINIDLVKEFFAEAGISF